MTREEWTAQLKRWEAKYGKGGAVPLDTLRKVVAPTETDYILKNYYYDPMLRSVVSKKTGKVQRGQNLSCGGHHSPVTLARGEWILRMGYSPWRVGMDEGGLFAKDGPGEEKRYVA